MKCLGLNNIGLYGAELLHIELQNIRLDRNICMTT